MCRIQSVIFFDDFYISIYFAAFFKEEDDMDMFSFFLDSQYNRYIETDGISR